MSVESIIVYVDEDLEELVPEFLENRYEDVTAIRTLLASGDFEEIQRLGHSMKGSGGGYGFFEITDIGSKIEEAAKTRDIDCIAAKLGHLVDYLGNVKVVYKVVD
jgi:HPt (histidine-containing phosphotransfer) domain-containing protein